MTLRLSTRTLVLLFAAVLPACAKVIPGQAGLDAQLVFAVQPGKGTASQVMTPAVVVELRDASGLITRLDRPVTMDLAQGPTGAVLGGTLTVHSVGGVATFGDLTVSLPGQGFRLRASAPHLDAALSQPFDVDPELVLAASAGADLEVYTGQDLRFTVTATDPQGDRVTLRLMNPPPGCVFVPLEGAASPAQASVRWLVPTTHTGLQRLEFLAIDNAVPPARATLTVTARVVPGGGR